MALDIHVESEEFLGNEDRSWLGSQLSAEHAPRSITLDVSTFTDNHVSDKGAIPSGTVLGKITASGKYGPYDAGAGDGRETAAGLLFNTTKVGPRATGGATSVDLTTAADVGAPLFWAGVVITSKLPTFPNGETAGLIDAGGKTDLPMIRWE